MRDRQLCPKAAYKVHKKHKKEKLHGTRYSYVLGCRCSSCTIANREYGLGYRARKRGNRSPRPGNRRMRWPIQELEQRKSLTVDSVVIIQRKVLPYSL